MIDEALARKEIDKLLKLAGWVIQDYKDFNRTASKGVAVREFPLKNQARADYLLFIDSKAVGVIEAKKPKLSLSGAANQSSYYANNLPSNIAHYQMPLPFIYESNSSEIYFTDIRDINACSRKIFAFHKPETLLELLQSKSTLRNNLKSMPPLNAQNLRQCQIEAITALEKSLAQNKSRSLIQMATGAGKTFTACNFTYRLIKHTGAKRILFLVDRNNLGKQTKKEFDAFTLPDENRKFSEVYIVQHLAQNHIDKDAKVVITTIQRLYSMLSGEAEFDAQNEEISAFESDTNPHKAKEVLYNPNFPIEFFDFVIVDECHRSIYGEWQQILEYFDAFIIGLTATPSLYTLGYFQKNLVSEYPLERSIIDGVNVDCEIFRIKTKITESGSKIEAKELDFVVPVRDKRTRQTKYEDLKDDLEYDKTALDKSIVALNQIRTILQAYKNALFTQLFPEREPSFVPKTLIFAKDDHHAEEIVRITREVFAKGNDFCKKITYNIGNSTKPDELIKEFRTSPNFRIAVTVDMIATGTDIKPLEVLIFMRDVKSKLYYEQMKGRGVRTINKSDLQSVTPNANSKTHFYIIDAVGVTESQKFISQPLERKKSTSLKKLLEDVAKGDTSDDTLSTLAGRLVRIEANLEKADEAKIQTLTNNKTLSIIAKEIFDCINPDLNQNKTEQEIGELKEKAIYPFNNPELRQTLLDLSSKSKIIIDEISTDEILSGEFSHKNSQEKVSNFENFINENKDKVNALSIIYNTSYKARPLLYKDIKELENKLSSLCLDISNLWESYGILYPNKVAKNPQNRLTNLIQLVRFALKLDDELVDFGVVANSRYELWKGRQIKRGINFTPEQLRLLDSIKEHIISNVSVSEDDLQNVLFDFGGIFKARKVFGDNLDSILQDLSLALVG